jgi:hypothetical protein
MYSGIDYVGAIFVALMILSPLAAAQSHVSHNGSDQPVTQQQSQ